MQEVDILIEGGIDLTLDGADTILHSGSVAVRGDRIVAVGPRADIASRYRGRRVVDASGRVVMPGLVNAHTHAAMTCFRGIADDLELMEWLNRYIFPAEAKNVDPSFPLLGQPTGLRQLIRSARRASATCTSSRTRRPGASLAGRMPIGRGALRPPASRRSTRGLPARSPHEKWRATISCGHRGAPCPVQLLAGVAEEVRRAGRPPRRAPLSLHLLETRSEREGYDLLGCSPAVPGTRASRRQPAGLPRRRPRLADIEMIPAPGRRPSNPSNMKLARTPPCVALQAAGVTVASARTAASKTISICTRRGHGARSTGLAARSHGDARRDCAAWANVDGARPLGLSGSVG